jgi:hypothetical protein
MRPAILTGVAVLGALAVCGCKVCHKMKMARMYGKAFCGSDPMCHIDKIKCKMKKLACHLKCDTERIEEPKAKAMFGSAAETICGLIKVFNDYKMKNEAAWK